MCVNIVYCLRLSQQERMSNLKRIMKSPVDAPVHAIQKEHVTNISFNVLHHLLGDSKLIEEQVQKPYNSIRSIITSDCFQNEVCLIRRIIIRLNCVLRSSTAINRVNQRLMSKFNKVIGDAFVNGTSQSLWSPLLKETIDNTTGDLVIPKNETVVNLLSSVKRCGLLLREVIWSCLFVGRETLRWINLGHMLHHMLPLFSCVSRLNVLSRSILVYLTDLYNGLYNFLIKLKGSLLAKQAHLVPSIHFLIEWEASSGKEYIAKNTEETIDKNTSAKPNEDFGIPISRSLVTSEASNVGSTTVVTLGDKSAMNKMKKLKRKSLGNTSEQLQKSKRATQAKTEKEPQSKKKTSKKCSRFERIKRSLHLKTKDKRKLRDKK